MSRNTSLLTFSIAASLMLINHTAEAGFVKKLITEATRPAKSVAKEVGRATEKVVKESERTAEKVVKESERTAKKIGDETERGLENIGEGVEVAAKSTVKLAEADVGSISTGVELLAHGDIEGAVRAVSIDHLQAVEDIAAEATIESSAINLVGQVAATAYGGPFGPAVYSSWQTYHASGGNWQAAAKGGLVTLASSGVTDGAGMIPGDAGMSTGAVMRVATSGAGSAGVAALAGGDEKAIRDGFLMGAMTTAMAETYRATTGIDMSGKVATEGAVAKDPKVPITNYDPNASHVGLEVPVLGLERKGFLSTTVYLLAEEQGPLMQGVAKIPGMNRMAYFHDTWMRNTSITTPGWVQVSILPAMAVSYMATGVPLAQQLQDDTE